MSLHVGTIDWSYAFWKGTFYPENLASKEFLAFYARQFDTVEVDSTFYRIPRNDSRANFGWTKIVDLIYSGRLKSLAREQLR